MRNQYACGSIDWANRSEKEKKMAETQKGPYRGSEEPLLKDKNTGVIPENEGDGFSKKEPSILEKIGSAVNQNLQQMFYRIGFFAAEKPWVMISLALVVMAISCVGFLWFETENRIENLWIPTNSPTTTDAAYYSIFYSGEPRLTEMVFQIPGENLLTKEYLLQALEIHDQIMELSINASWNGEPAQEWNFTTLCQEDYSGQCEMVGILSKWNYDASVLEADGDILGTINSDSTLRNLEQVLGEIGYSQDGTQVLSATTLRHVYGIENRRYNDNNAFVDPPAEAWEMEFIATFLLSKPDNSPFDHYGKCERSDIDEFNQGLDDDIVLLSVSITFVLIYLVIVLGEFSALRSRSLLAWWGILSIGFGVVFSLGVCSMIGIPFNYVNSVFPFILLAIGVDNCFILFVAFSGTNVSDSLEHRSGESLAHAGVSVTVTSLTNFSAFIIGCTTSLPAITSFCVYTALAIISLYFFQITFFVACIVLDERRVLANRRDCCSSCCGSLGVLKTQEQLDLYVARTNNRGRLSRFLENKLAPFVLNIWCKLFIVFLALGFIGVSAYNATQITIADYISNSLSDDSYLVAFQDISEQAFVDYGSPVFIVISQENLDYFEIQDFLSDLPTLISDNEYVQEATPVTFIDWYSAYLLWLPTSPFSDLLDEQDRPPTSSDFHSWLAVFLGTEEGNPYADDVILVPGDRGLTILTARWTATYEPLDGTIPEIRAMQTLRDTCNDLEYLTFPWTYDYIDWEQNAVVEDEIARNLLLTFAVIFLITLILLAHPWMALLVMIFVGATVLDIIGAMYLWGLTFDSITVVNLILAVGLSVDYTAHMAHCFMLQLGTREHRVTQTYADIAPGVIYGGISTLLAVIILAGSSSYVFVTLFKQFLLVVLFGLFHGLFVLPVVLSWVGPKPYPSVWRGEDNIPQNIRESVMDYQRRWSAVAETRISRASQMAPPNENTL
eukprot:Lithocolla_globosa_v1_NODE_944_length_3053_cov_15.868913.p1 type:complete len:955 gc:universal NODE_944_length_3053_cov_15.868913:172-3036(+)